MSLSDPLTLLRDFTVAKRPIELQGEHIVFGSTRFARSAPTAYREKGGAGDYYATDALWFLLENSSLGHGAYVQKCGQQGVKVVSLADRKRLLQYLQGEVAESSAVDYARYQPVQPEVADERVTETIDIKAEEEEEEVDEAKRAEEEEKRLKQMSEAKAAFAKILEDPKAVDAPKPSKATKAAKAATATPTAPSGAAPAAAKADAAGGEGEGAVAPAAADLATGEGTAAAAEEGEAPAPGAAQDTGVAAVADAKSIKELAKAFVKDDREKTKAIIKREKRLASRKSILLSDSLTSFPLVTQVHRDTSRCLFSSSPRIHVRLPVCTDPALAPQLARSWMGSRSATGRSWTRRTSGVRRQRQRDLPRQWCEVVAPPHPSLLVGGGSLLPHCSVEFSPRWRLAAPLAILLAVHLA